MVESYETPEGAENAKWWAEIAFTIVVIGILPTENILRSVDLWKKGCVKSRTFLLRRDASFPPAICARLRTPFSINTSTSVFSTVLPKITYPSPHFQVCLTILNCWSVKWSSRFHTFLTGFKLVPLVIIVIGGIYNMAVGRIEHLQAGFAPIEESAKAIIFLFHWLSDIVTTCDNHNKTLRQSTSG